MRFGSKAERTKKCQCENPNHSVFDFTTSKLGKTFIVTLSCSNCNALWDTKKMTKDIFNLLNLNYKKQYLNILEKQIQNEKDSIIICEESIDKLQLSVEKHNKKLMKLNEKLKEYSIISK